MISKGYKLPLLGLTLGFLLGLGVVSFKSYIAHELIEALNDEAKIGCNCVIKYDSLSLSLLTRSAIATNVRLEEKGLVRMQFPTINADFSFEEIRNRRIFANVTLKDGHSDGVGERSATYRFIDQLSSPPPPERDRPGRFKVKLQNLFIRNSSITERFSHSELHAEGVSMDMHRGDDTDFRLYPIIKKLSFTTSLNRVDKTPRQIILGDLEGSLILRDTFVDFKRLRLDRAESFLDLFGRAFTKEKGRLEGAARFVVDARSLRLPSFINFKAGGEATASGRLAEPAFNGTLSLLPEGPFSLSFKEEIASLNSGEATFFFHVKDDLPFVDVPSGAIRSSDANLTLVAPFTLHDEELGGRMQLSLGTIAVDGAVIKEVKAEATLSGNLDQALISVEATADSLNVESLTVSNPRLSLKVREDEEIGFLFSAHNESEILNITGAVLTKPGRPLSLKESSFTISNLPLGDRSEILGNPYLLSVQGAIRGDLSSAAVSGEAHFSVVRSESPFKFNGEAILKDGVLTLKGENGTKTLLSNAILDLLQKNRSHLTVRAENFSLSEMAPDAECAHLTGSLEYDFNLPLMDQGDGTLGLSRVDLGCNEYRLSLEKEKSFPIKNGLLSLSGLHFAGIDTSLGVEGTVHLSQGTDLTIGGNLQLHTVAGLLPTVDDIEGSLVTAVKIKGTPGALSITGNAALQDGLLTIESSDISARKVNGSLQFVPDGFVFKNFTGLLNGGAFDVTGSIYPLLMERSSIHFNAHDVLITPQENTSLVTSADLTLSRGESGNALIKGAVTIESGEFQKSIDMTTILRALSRYIFFSSAQREGPGARGLPKADLDVTFTAPRNLFVVTNWAGVELNANLRITGTLAVPIIEGTMESVSGQFLLKDRQFEITSGVLKFIPGTNEPRLEVIAESSIRSHTGDTVLVLLEASGPLTQPRVVVNSDRGLTQREIFNLLTAGGGSDVDRTLINRGGRNTLSMLGRGEWNEDQGFGRFLRNLARIDSILIEPSYNTQTGVIEPTIVARKNISDRLSLIGESSIGTTTSDSRLRLIYNLTPSVNVAGIVESSSTKQTTAVGTDLTYTILAEQNQFLKTTIVGNDAVSRDEILSAIRLTDSAQLPVEEIDKLTKSVKKFYDSSGFFDSTVSADCAGATDMCRELSLEVIEGPQSHIRNVRWEGEDSERLKSLNDVLKIKKNTPATKAILERFEKTLTHELRNEGYIAARVEARYEETVDPAKKDLVISILAGQPVTFTFVGNKKFSPKDFLETINLFNRKQPFGTNTINILVQNIERMYREAGYLYATITFDRQFDSLKERVNYLITIQEEQRIAVGEVKIEGNLSLSTEKLQQRFAESFGEFYDEMWSPQYAIDERLEENVQTLKAIYTEEGFPAVEVSYRLLEDEKKNSLDIVYSILEGEPLRAEALVQEGLPDDVMPPSLPRGPYSIPKANRYIQSLLNALNDAGYHNPGITTEFDENPFGIRIKVTPGVQTRVGTIEIDGNLNIASAIIERSLKIHDGDPWNLNKIDETKRRLLSLGLFSRVSIAPSDGTLDSSEEDLVIKVVERPLDTLEVGVGANSEYGAHFFGEAVDKALFHDGRSLSLRVDSYYDSVSAEVSQGVANLRYSDPYVLGLDSSLNQDLRFQKLDLSTQEFDLNRISLATYINSTWENGLSHTIGHTFAQDNLDNVSQDAILSSLDEGIVNVSFLSGSVIYDERDDPVLPTTGLNAKFDYKLSSQGIGSDSDFYSVGAKIGVLRPLQGISRRLSVALTIGGASAWTFGGTEQVPITQRYYLGGRNAIRGFRENSLGPRGSAGSVLGGDVLLANSAELRYLTTDTISLHIFVDAGNVFLRNNDPHYGDLRYSTGIGIRYLSPIGPIGMDIGHPLDRARGESPYRVHFDIGASF